MDGLSEATHSPVGPSSLDRVLNCPGSLRATENVPDVDKMYAMEGTAAHTLAEQARDEDMPAAHYLGEKIFVNKVDGSEMSFVVDQEMADAVQTYIDHVNSLPGFDFNESRVYYTNWVVDGFGTLDAARGNDGTVYLRDLKYGKGVQVFAEHNVQLMTYALGFYQTYGYLFDIKEFNLGIVQPRLDHIDEWTISLKELLIWADYLLSPFIKAARQPDAFFRAGDHCKFCKIKQTCRTRAEAVFVEATEEFQDLDAAIDAPVRAVGQLTNDQIAKALKAIPNIVAWCADIKKHAMGEIAQGRAVGDYKIVAGRGSREYVGDGDGGTAQLLEAMYPDVDPVQFWEPQILKSVAQVEKTIGKKRFEHFAKSWVRKVDGKPTLAPGSDKRAAITLDAGAEFDDVEE